MEKPILELEDARLTVAGNNGPVEILRGINLQIFPKQTLGLIGPSGSGKSSLLMLMGGFEQASAGRVTAFDQNLGQLNEDQLARLRRHKMSIVFQDFHLIPTMNALENVALPLEITGDRASHEKAAEALDHVGLSQRLHHYPAHLSGGEQQRVALARAIVTRPQLFLADEPTGSLDSVNGAAIMDLLFNLRDLYGATLVLVTHAPELAARCDRTVKLIDGQIAS